MDNESLIKKYVAREKIEESLNKLKEGMPVQYIIGNVDFYGYEFIVNKNVLIPRFETETLVEKTIGYIKKYNLKNLKIADLGTGSGCIGITLNKELNVNVTCFDISENALDVAKLNKEKLDSDVELIKHDILKKIPGKYNVLISNPPYISREMEVEEIVKNHEPSIALYAENNGYLFYEKILEYSKSVIDDKFIIAFEIGYEQKQYLYNLAKSIYPKAFISIENDLTGKNRYLFIISE